MSPLHYFEKVLAHLSALLCSVAKRAIFQATASMLFPSLTIHSIVKYSAIAIKKYKVRNLFVQRWGASLLGKCFLALLRAT